MEIPVSARRAPERLPVFITIAGRAYSLSLSVRPLTALLATADMDQAELAARLQAEAPAAGHDGWSLALLSPEGEEIIPGRRMCGTTDFWRPFRAALIGRFGAHLALAISSTPSGLLPLGGQCSLTLSAIDAP